MKIRSLAIRLAAFLGGLTGIVPSSLDEFGPVNRAKPRAKARMIDLGPRRDKNRYRPFRLEYPTDLPQFPVTRQVMRAELRAMAFKQTAYGLLKNEPRHDRRSASVNRINVRSFIAGFSWGGMLTHDQLVWCRAWARKSGRLFYYEREA